MKLLNLFKLDFLFKLDCPDFPELDTHLMNALKLIQTQQNIENVHDITIEKVQIQIDKMYPILQQQTQQSQSAFMRLLVVGLSYLILCFFVFIYFEFAKLEYTIALVLLSLCWSYFIYDFFSIFTNFRNTSNIFLALHSLDKDDKETFENLLEAYKRSQSDDKAERKMLEVAKLIADYRVNSGTVGEDFAPETLEEMIKIQKKELKKKTRNNNILLIIGFGSLILDGFFLSSHYPILMDFITHLKPVSNDILGMMFGLSMIKVVCFVYYKGNCQSINRLNERIANLLRILAIQNALLEQIEAFEKREQEKQ